MKSSNQRARMMERFERRRASFKRRDPEYALCTIIIMMLGYGASTRTINQRAHQFRTQEYQR